MEHIFTQQIKQILTQYLGNETDFIFDNSPLIQYLNLKTKSASRGSKSRGSFANLYAIYVLVEDYITNNFHIEGDYTTYAGAIYSNLFTRQRTLPFGGSLQNHALNNRLNAEFKKYFPAIESGPIIRDLLTERYWINANLLVVKTKDSVFNIAPAVISIIDAYTSTKQDAFERFIEACTELQHVSESEPDKAEIFITSLLAPNIDARLFEIVSYAILKYHYQDQYIIWGFDYDNLIKESLILYKTGRTNANDGGIDFVMKPLGRFFQVTETLDFKKYFLDIDKTERYPITFVIKSEQTVEELIVRIRETALKTYPVQAIVEKYMACIEELINIPQLLIQFQSAILKDQLINILQEIVRQSKIEFNYAELDDSITKP